MAKVKDWKLHNTTKGYPTSLAQLARYRETWGMTWKPESEAENCLKFQAIHSEFDDLINSLLSEAEERKDPIRHTLETIYRKRKITDKEATLILNFIHKIMSVVSVVKTICIQEVKVFNGTSKAGKPYTSYNVTTDEGVKYSSFDEFVEGEEVEVAITPNSNPQYPANIKKTGNAPSEPQAAKPQQPAAKVATGPIDPASATLMLAACTLISNQAFLSNEEAVEKTLFVYNKLRAAL